MIVLHAGLLNDQVIIWAEEQVSLRAFGDAKQTKRARKNRHPFSAPYARILSAIEQSALPEEMDSSRVATIQAWLPSAENFPVPSSRLLCTDDDVFEFQPPTKHLPWAIDTVAMHALEIVALVERAQTGHILTPGVILSSEFSFIVQLARFSSALVARQQYLPGVVQRGGDYFACWKPIFSPDDHAKIQDFADLMPPVVRALTSVQSSSRAPSAPPATLVTGYINAFVDDAARFASSKIVKSMPMRKNAYLSVHDCWLHALSSASGRMNFEAAEIEKFATQLGDWQHPLLISEFAEFRLCFRLEEPNINEYERESGLVQQRTDLLNADNWNVHYLLQCVKDPSLMIPAEDAWLNVGAVRKTFDASNFRPREQLLRSLGQASRLSEYVNDSLKAPTPSGFALSNSNVFQFLNETAQTLEEAGFGVMLPAWWRKGQRAKIKRRANVDSSMKIRGDKLTLDHVVEFNWELALGDITLTQAELETLTALKSPLVKIRGQWILVTQEDIQASIDFLQKKVRKKGTLGELVKLALTKTADDGAEVVVDARGWVGEFLKQLNSPHVMTELPTPSSFNGELRHYQQRGFSWLDFLSGWGLGACLADDMGLGKTIQTLALIQKQKNEGSAGPVLLVCPTSVVSNWCKESARFTPQLSVMVHHGGKRKKGDPFIKDVHQHDVVISTYGLLDRDRLQLQEISWTGVILDEAQNIKNNMTKQSVAARGLKSSYRIALTGTPVENSVADLYSIMEFLNPSFLGSSRDFRNRFLIPIQVEGNVLAEELLKEITQPFILRRVKTDKNIISDLPDKQEMKVYCSMSKEQVTLYSAVVDDLIERLAIVDPQRRAGEILAAMTQMKQVCNHPAHFNADNSELDGRSGKLDRLVEMIEEVLRSGEKALIFTQFAEMGKLIKKQLQEKFGEEVLFLHGGVSRKARDEMVERFQSADGPSLFVLSLKAGGTGLNLTAANHVFHFDRWWNPAVENQASDRAYRIGQKKNVQVRKFITAGTLEDKIDEIIDDKQRTADVVVGAGEGWLTALSNDDLKRVFTLSKEVFV